MEDKVFQIGWAQTSITPMRPLLMQGQMYMRVSGYVHDPLTATCLALDNGVTAAIFVSMDAVDVPVLALEPLKLSFFDHPEIPVEAISINATHSHNSSTFYHDCMRSENEEVYDKDILPRFEMPEDLLAYEQAQRFIVTKLHDLIVKAWQNRKPGGISFAHDYAAVAFNRRPQFGCGEDAESIMYGDCSREDFLGFEDGTDTSVELMYTFDADNRVTGVVCNVPCPSQVYELHCFLSADYWAPTRQLIREKLGENVYVLPLCGAAGDLAPVDLVQISKTNRQALKDWGGQTKEVFRNFDMTLLCQSIGQRISEAVVRGYQTARNYINPTPAFLHEVFSMKLPIRQVSEEEYLEAEKEVAEYHSRFRKENPMQMPDLVQAFEPQGVILRYRQQKQEPEITIQCHILRLDRAGFATNPFELFHVYGQRMKARCKADQLFIIQLSNGSAGYLPTRKAVLGGSYSAKPASTVCGPDGGDALVEKTLTVLDRMF